MYSFMVGVMHAGLTPFPIAPRNSVQAIAQLIEATGISLLYVSSDTAMQQLARGAVDVVRARNEIKLAEMVTMPLFEELYRDDGEVEGDLQVNVMKADHTAIICHTTGTASYVSLLKMF
jgi:acyl-coenzyme A synthetase/AMP-(fatty) acid ligase